MKHYILVRRQVVRWFSDVALPEANDRERYVFWTGETRPGYDPESLASILFAWEAELGRAKTFDNLADVVAQALRVGDCRVARKTSVVSWDWVT